MHVVIAGLEPALAGWLSSQFPSHRFTALAQLSEAEALLERDPAGLLVADLGGAAPDRLEALGAIRRGRSRAELGLVGAVERGVDTAAVVQLVNELGVDQLVFKPIDRDELARQTGRLLGIEWTPQPEPARAQLAASMASIWERFKDATLKRVGVLEAAAAAVLDGSLSEEQRRAAEREAHKLKGSLGTFGFVEGARLASDLDGYFQPGHPLSRGQGLLLTEKLVSLRAELSRGPGLVAAPAAPAAGPDDQRRLLIADDDALVAEQLAQEARSRGFEVVTAESPGAARAAVKAARPGAVVLDLAFGEGQEDGRVLLAELAAGAAGVPVLVYTGKNALIDRVEVARLGGAGFLQKSAAAPQVLDAVEDLLRSRQNEPLRVMITDDDPSIVEAVTALLGERGIPVTGLSDSLRFWAVLEEAQPDLLVLDVDMPYLSGIELCRVLRNDLRWNQLPVVFLSARTDADTVTRIYATGADDYVTKPIVPIELVTRITNRLERARLLRRLAENDPLTGVANRTKATQVLEHYLRLASRQQRPLSVAMVDLDHFKRINDSYGHATGDAVLRRTAELMGRFFRAEDVVARWGGEEFLIGMYGCARADGAARLQAFLEALRQERFEGADGRSFSLTISAGVAEFPGDGEDVQGLYLAADRALYQAKQAGRGRVVQVGETPAPAAVADLHDW